MRFRPTAVKFTALLLTVVFGLFSFDSAGLTGVAHESDATTEYVHTPKQPNKISDTDRAQRTIKYRYDAANRLIKTIYPDDTPLSDADNPRTTSEYDKAGQMIASIDERGNRTEYEYDEAGRQVLMRNALLEETVYEYDELNRRTAVIDAKLQRTEFIYDDAGRLTDTIYPDDTPLDDLDNTTTTTEHCQGQVLRFASTTRKEGAKGGSSLTLHHLRCMVNTRRLFL